MAIKKINKQTLAAIKNNKIELKKATQEIKEDTELFKKESRVHQTYFKQLRILQICELITIR